MAKRKSFTNYLKEEKNELTPHSKSSNLLDSLNHILKEQIENERKMQEQQSPTKNREENRGFSKLSPETPGDKNEGEGFKLVLNNNKIKGEEDSEEGGSKQ